MASARTSRTREGWRPALLGSLILSVPFLAAGCYATGSLFLSNHHAHLIEKALMAVDRGRLELIGFVYPPLPFLLLLAWPTAALASALAALAAGATAWILWRRLAAGPAPLGVRALLLIAALGTPPLLYLGSQSFSEMLALLLFLAAWLGFLRFTRSRQSCFGVLAGLGLGAAFFVNHYSALLAVPCALSAPLFLRDRGGRAAVAAAFVLLFPVLLGVLAWTYLNWLFTGDPLTFTRGPATSVFAYWRSADDGWPVGWTAALTATARDLRASPLYLVIGILVALYWPTRILLFAAPAALIAAARAAGMVYPDYFAVGTLSVAALAALHPRLPRRMWPALALGALVHLWVGYATPLGGDLAGWKERILNGRASSADVEEAAVGEFLATRPAASVLLDDRTAYRIVARAGTARPFVLPADPLYQLAESQPAEFTRYLLVAAKPSEVAGGRLATLYATVPPPAVRLAARWPSWRLYERLPLDATRVTEDGPVTGGHRPPRRFLGQARPPS